MTDGYIIEARTSPMRGRDHLPRRCAISVSVRELAIELAHRRYADASLTVVAELTAAQLQCFGVAAGGIQDVTW